MEMIDSELMNMTITEVLEMLVDAGNTSSVEVKITNSEGKGIVIIGYEAVKQ